MQISRDSWNIIQRVIRRYPETKRRYQDALDVAMFPGVCGDGSDSNEADPDYTKPVSITEAAALRLNAPYVQRLKKEIEAIESAIDNLNPDERVIISTRYWTDRNRNQQYQKMFKLPFSEMTMRRVCRRFIIAVGRKIGELDDS